MAVARSEQLDLEFTQYFHCVPTCVRRAHLCGTDPTTGEDFGHRRDWIEQRILQLPSTFAVDVCAYAVMPNHLHLLLRVDIERAASWDEEEVRTRFGDMFPLAKERAEALNAKGQRDALKEWRERLGSLSWAMRSLNEWVARKANREDGCRGRFWEGRFQSQPLLNLPSVVMCGAFIDLNPIRNGIDERLGSKATSIGKRLQLARGVLREDGLGGHRSMSAFAQSFEELGNRRRRQAVPRGLVPFSDQVPLSWKEGVPEHQAAPMPTSLSDYIRLLEWTRKAVVKGSALPVPVDVLERLEFAPEHWVRTMAKPGLSKRGVLGSIDSLRDYAAAQGKAWVRGVGHAKLAKS